MLNHYFNLPLLHFSVMHLFFTSRTRRPAPQKPTTKRQTPAPIAIHPAGDSETDHKKVMLHTECNCRAQCICKKFTIITHPGRLIQGLNHGNCTSYFYLWGKNVSPFEWKKKVPLWLKRQVTKLCSHWSYCTGKPAFLTVHMTLNPFESWLRPENPGSHNLRTLRL